MATATHPNARIIDMGENAEQAKGQVCQPVDENGYPVETACGRPSRYVALHTPRGTSPGPLHGSHNALCIDHVREQIVRCLKWQCRGAR